MKFQALLISFIVIAASAAPLEVATPGNIEVQVCKDGAHGVVGIRKSLAWDKRKLRNVAARSEEEDTATVEDTVSTPKTSGGTRIWEKRALVEDSVFAAETGGGAWIWEKRDGLDIPLGKGVSDSGDFFWIGIFCPSALLLCGGLRALLLFRPRTSLRLLELHSEWSLWVSISQPLTLCTGSAVPRISSDSGFPRLTTAPENPSAGTAAPPAHPPN
ncbi:hypothetical protein DFH09DRAFT_1476092 [Mycena vulgaris]|nr:hypothetical protein DFH09DRAFT_1476092 [Mycena vulgaris]